MSLSTYFDFLWWNTFKNHCQSLAPRVQSWTPVSSGLLSWRSFNFSRLASNHRFCVWTDKARPKHRESKESLGIRIKSTNMIEKGKKRPVWSRAILRQSNWVVFFRKYGYIIITSTWNSQFSMVHHHMFANSARSYKESPEEKSVHFDSQQCELSHIGLFKHFKRRKTSFCFLTATTFDARKSNWCVPWPCFGVTSIVKLWDNTVLYHHG